MKRKTKAQSLVVYPLYTSINSGNSPSYLITSFSKNTFSTGTNKDVKLQSSFTIPLDANILG